MKGGLFCQGKRCCCCHRIIPMYKPKQFFQAFCQTLGLVITRSSYSGYFTGNYLRVFPDGWVCDKVMMSGWILAVAK